MEYLKKDLLYNLKKSLNSNFFKSVFVMASGSTLAQMINLLFSPFLTRIYGPEAFGVLGLFISIISVVTPMSALTLPTAIVLPKKNSEAVEITKASLSIIVVNALLTGMVIFFLRDYIIKVFNLSEISSFLYLIPFTVVIMGLVQITTEWVVRTKNFKLKSKGDVYKELISNIMKLVVGLFFPLAFILILFSLSGHLIYITFLLMGLHKAVKHISHRDSLSFSSTTWGILKKYKDFPLFRAPQALLEAFTQSLPIIILTAFFGPAPAGLYTIGKKVVKLPSILIGTSIGMVYYQRASEEANKSKPIFRLFMKSTLTLILTGIIPFSVFFFFSPVLFSLVFGSDWHRAGVYATWISLWAFSNFINYPAVRTLPVINAQKFHLKFSVYNITTKCLALVIGAAVFNNDLAAIILYSSTGAINNLIMISITGLLCSKFDQKNETLKNRSN